MANTKITTNVIADDAITTAKIADDAVGNDQLASGLTLGGNTAATLSTAAQPNITSVGTLSALTVDDITINGSTISDAGEFTLDIGGNIILDSAGAETHFAQNGTVFGKLYQSGNDFYINNPQSDEDIIFTGNDGGSSITALTLDMSEGGNATFSGDITAPNIKATTEFQIFAGGTDIGAIFNSGGALTIQGTSTRDVSIGSDSNTNAIFIEGTNGKVGIGGTPTDGTLHVLTASAGTVAASTQADDIVIENSAEGGMTIITPDDQSARIRFTSPSTNTTVGGASIFYRQNINKMNIGTEVSGGILALLSGAGSETMRLDNNGNVNIGAKDYHTHNSTVDSLQIGYALNLYEDSYNTGTDNYVIWANNAYYATSGGNKYMRNDEASRLMQDNGNLTFQNAAAGTADNSITFVDRLKVTSAGNLEIKNDGQLVQTVASGGGDYLLVTHTGNEAWSWGARSGSGVDDYVDVGISGGTRCMTWHESGRVGVGNTAPAFDLDVGISGEVQARFKSTGDTGFTQGAIVCESSDSTSSPQDRGQGVYMFNHGTDKTWYMGTTYADAGTFQIAVVGGSTLQKSAASHGSSQGALRINAGRQVMMGSAAHNDDVLYLTRGNAGKLLRFYQGGSEVGYIGTTSGTTSLPSDKNFKKDINDLNLGLDFVKSLNPKTFRLKIEENDSPLSTGLIAQEIEESLTQAGITKNSLGFLQHKPNEDAEQSQYWINNESLIPVLINAIQELKAEIDALKEKLNG